MPCAVNILLVLGSNEMSFVGYLSVDPVRVSERMSLSMVGCGGPEGRA
jgi:ketopantoate hydroxymethyltransferase